MVHLSPMLVLALSFGAAAALDHVRFDKSTADRWRQMPRWLPNPAGPGTFATRPESYDLARRLDEVVADGEVVVSPEIGPHDVGMVARSRRKAR